MFATTYPRIRSLQGSSFEMAGYSAVTHGLYRSLVGGLFDNLSEFLRARFSLVSI